MLPSIMLPLSDRLLLCSPCCSCKTDVLCSPCSSHKQSLRCLPHILSWALTCPQAASQRTCIHLLWLAGIVGTTWQRRTRLDTEVHPVLCFLCIHEAVEVCDPLLRVWIARPQLGVHERQQGWSREPQRLLQAHLPCPCLFSCASLHAVAQASEMF